MVVSFTEKFSSLKEDELYKNLVKTSPSEK